MATGAAARTALVRALTTPLGVATAALWGVAAGGAALLPRYPGLDGAHRLIVAGAVCLTIVRQVRRRRAMDDRRHAATVLRLGRELGAMQAVTEMVKQADSAPPPELATALSTPGGVQAVDLTADGDQVTAVVAGPADPGPVCQYLAGQRS